MWHVSFTHLWAVWLGAAAAVPVIIHLLARQKPRVVHFPGVQFIRRGQRKSFHRTRLKHLLLLLMRMGLILLCALIVSRPFLHAGAAEGAGQPAAGTPAAVLILDDSLSMRYRTGDATWFDTARGRALELAGRLTDQTAAAVLTASRPRGKLQRDAEALAARIAGLRPGSGAASCWAALESAAEMLRERGASRRDVFLFTDLTEGAWVGRGRRTLQMGEDVDLYIVDCAPEGGANGAVLELREEGEPAVAGAMVRLEARVAASGEPQARVLQFEFDGEPVERREVNLGPGEETTVAFRALLDRAGHHWGRVAFLNPDGLPQDDARAFTVEAVQDVAVLCVEDDPEGTLESVSHFFRLALNPWAAGRRGIFKVRRASPAELAGLPLGPFDVVALVGAGSIGEQAWRRLRSYVTGGGGLLVFLGPETAGDYRTEAARGVLPAEVGEPVVAAADEPFRLRVLEPSHPVMSALDEAGVELARVRFGQCREVRAEEGAEVLMAFGAGLPALVVSEAGGRTALLASTADERWGNLSTTPAFVVLCHELLLHLARRSTAGIRQHTVGAHVPIEFEPSRWPTIVHVVRPGESTPERLLPGTTPGRMVYWKTDAPGYYRVAFEQHEESWEGGFAVNTVPIESRLEKVPFDELRESISAGQVRLVGDASMAEDQIGGPGGARELTPYLAVLALALLAAECFLANRFYRAEAT